MENTLEQRIVIKFHAKLGLTPAKTYEMMKEVYRNKCLSRSNVFIWHKRFSEGRKSLQDNYRAPPPRTARTPQMIDQVREYIENDPKASMRVIADSLGIAKGTVQSIISEDLKRRREPIVRMEKETS